jgi:hypothetical protein
MYMIQDIKKLGPMMQEIKGFILLTVILMILLVLAMVITSSLMNAIGMYLLF